MLWTRRPAEERNGAPYRWIYGLCGVSAESSIPGWTALLTSGEASTAAAYATVELNGFAPFIADLTKSHPAEVDAEIGTELNAELSVGGGHRLFAHSSGSDPRRCRAARLLAPRRLLALQTWPSTISEETGPHWAHHLEQVLRTLGEVSGEADRQVIAHECASRYEVQPSGPLALVWLKGLFRFDAQLGTQVLIGSLSSRTDPSAHAIRGCLPASWRA